MPPAVAQAAAVHCAIQVFPRIARPALVPPSALAIGVLQFTWKLGGRAL